MIYVEDLIITGSDTKQINNFKCETKNKMKDFGPISYYLHLSISQSVNEAIVTLNQSYYL